MTARETADRLAEMTGGFDLRRDAIDAAIIDAYRRGEESMRERAAEVVRGKRFGHSANGRHYYVTWPAWNPKGNESNERDVASLAIALEAAIRALLPRSANEQETRREP